MIQKNIRDWGGVPYTNEEADELTQELNDRTVSSQDGYNSVDELASKVKAAETNINLKEDKADKGVANGYAELDSSGRVPAAQVPGSVDEVQEYANLAAFPATGQSDVIYVALDTNKTYRWGGTIYVELSSGSLVLGETSTTAYRGDRGKAAYDHSLTAHAPSNAEANQTDAEIKTQYEANANTNAFTDAQQTKLSQIEDGATADQTLPTNEVGYGSGTGIQSNTNFRYETNGSTYARLHLDTVFGDTGVTLDAGGSGIAKLEVDSSTNAEFQIDGAEAVKFVHGDNSEMLSIEKDSVLTHASYVPTLDQDVSTKKYVDDTAANLVSNDPTGDIAGALAVTKILYCTQAQYDAGTPNATTLYIITDA